MSIVTKAVRFISSVHGTTTAFRRGEKSFDDIFRATFFTPERFPAFLVVTMIASGTVGFQSMETIKRSRTRNPTRRYSRGLMVDSALEEVRSDYPNRIVPEKKSVDPKYR